MSFFRKRWVVSLAGLIAVAALVALAVLAWDRTSPEDQLTQLATPVPTLQTAQQPPDNTDETVFGSPTPWPTYTPRPTYFLTSTPVDRQAQPTVTPVPKPTRPHPRLDVQPLITTKAGNTYQGNTYNLVTMPRDEWFSTPGAQGELCKLDVSPNGQWVAITMCGGEGYSAIFVREIDGDLAIQIGVPVNKGDSRFDPTSFQGWFPDSQRVLLLSEWGTLGISDITSGEFSRLSEVDQFITDAAIDPKGDIIVTTNIQGESLNFINTKGDLLITMPTPLDYPGDRPENLVWSDDGSRIAFTWDQGVAGGLGPVWIINTEKYTTSLLGPEDASFLSPQWLPGSEGILVINRYNTSEGRTALQLGVGHHR